MKKVNFVGRFGHFACCSVVCLLLVSGCLSATVGDENMTSKDVLRGQLVYNDNQRLYLIEFPNVKQYTLYASDNYIISITAKKTDRIIFDDCRENCTLKQLNLRTLDVKNLFPGELPLYLENKKSLIFYRDDVLYQFNEKTQQLTSIDQAPPRYPKRGSRGGDTYFVSVKIQPVAISSREFVYVGPDHTLTKYNVETQTKEKLPINEVRPLFWRKAAERLFYSKWDEALDAYEIDFETGETRPFTVRQYGGMTYIPSRDQMLYVSNPWYSIIYWFINIPEAKFIYLYDFETGESKQLGWGGPNDGIWLEPGTIDESLYKNGNEK